MHCRSFMLITYNLGLFTEYVNARSSKISALQSERILYPFTFIKLNSPRLRRSHLTQKNRNTRAHACPWTD